MNEQDPASRLSQISTHWSLLQQAHDADPDARRLAVEQLLAHYAAPIRRYLRASVKSPEVAEELLQEFAVRLLRGAFHKADPGQGRFRHYLKRSLIHLVLEFRKRQALDRQRFEPRDMAEVVLSAEAEQAQLAATWREELLDRSWNRLRALDAARGQSHYLVLRSRAASPGQTSSELAEQLNAQLRPTRPFTADGARKALQRAREAFGQALLDEVGHLTGTHDRSAIEDELAELKLLPYCRSALARWTSQADSPRSP